VPRPVSLARGSTVGVARQRALRAGAGAELGEELHDYRRLQLHGLPDDGNRYELVRGALFGTPAPRRSHEIILARLSELLAPFVRENGLGLVFHRAVMRFDASEVEPDLAVQQAHSIAEGNWDSAPTPNLVVEVLSGVTRRRDLDAKRALYLDAGISEYWVIDEDTKSIRVIRNGPMPTSFHQHPVQKRGIGAKGAHKLRPFALKCQLNGASGATTVARSRCA